MGQLEEIAQLLQEKEESFAAFEKATADLLTCTVDEVEEFMARREKLIHKIDAVNAALQEHTQGNDLLKNAVRMSCPRGALPEEYTPLYDAAQRALAHANRAHRQEPQIRARIETERDLLTEKIKENNKSVNAKAARFYGAEGQGVYFQPGFGKA